MPVHPHPPTRRSPVFRRLVRYIPSCKCHPSQCAVGHGRGMSRPHCSSYSTPSTHGFRRGWQRGWQTLSDCRVWCRWRASSRVERGGPAGIRTQDTRIKSLSGAASTGSFWGTLRRFPARPSVHLLHPVGLSVTAVAGSVAGTLRPRLPRYASTVTGPNGTCRHRSTRRRSDGLSSQRGQAHVTFKGHDSGISRRPATYVEHLHRNRSRAGARLVA